ncbi:YhcN/YlaJ family sporulation lipoprotein [Paenibacillus sp. CAU 1782]
MAKKIRHMLAVLLMCLVVAAVAGGCGMEKVGDLGNKNIRSNQVRYDANGNLLRDKRFADDQRNDMNRVNGNRLYSNNLIGSHKNYRVEMNAEVSNKLTEEIPPVKASYVLLANQNAYVALSLNEAEPKSNAKTLSRTGISMLGKGDARPYQGLRSLSTGEENLTDTIRSEVEVIVKRLRPDVEHVYISAHPEFVGRLNAYMNDAKEGYPVQNYIMEFNALAERIFPAGSKPTSEELLRPYGGRSGRLLE